jgi:hypothetical protein
VFKKKQKSEWRKLSVEMVDGEDDDEDGGRETGHIKTDADNFQESRDGNQLFLANPVVILKRPGLTAQVDSESDDPEITIESSRTPKAAPVLPPQSSFDDAADTTNTEVRALLFKSTTQTNTARLKLEPFSLDDDFDYDNCPLTTPRSLEDEVREYMANSDQNKSR